MRNIFLWFYKVTGLCSSYIGNLGEIYNSLSQAQYRNQYIVTTENLYQNLNLNGAVCIIVLFAFD